MNHSLEKIHIEKEQLSGTQYFQSLLEQAHHKGLLSDRETERLQYECIQLLARQTKRYNSGDSSSIRVEAAQSIMDSIFFTIGLWLKTFSDPADALAALQKEPMEEIWQKGRKHTDIMVTAARNVHKKLLKRLVDTPNVYYRSTLVEGLKGFFKLYNPEFSAQEIHITADYPAFNPLPELAGIEFITAYLHALYYENLFCGFFAADDIHHLLCGYETDYRELVINIYEPVLLTAIGSAIIGRDGEQTEVIAGINGTQTAAAAGEGWLHYTIEEMEYLQQLFAEMPENEVLPTVQKAAAALGRHFQFPDELTRYLQNSLPLIVSKIKTAVREATLDRVFFTPAFPENNPKTVVSFGEKMDDEQYRKVVAEIRECRFIQDKMALIKEAVHSLADLEDVLLDADLAPEEIKAVLRELSLPEAAALARKYPLLPQPDMAERREQEQVLRKSLHDYIARMSPAQQETNF